MDTPATTNQQQLVQTIEELNTQKEHTTNQTDLTDQYQMEQELQKRKQIYEAMVQQCQTLNLEMIESGAKDLDSFVFPLYSDEVLSRLVSDIKEMQEPPDYQTLSLLTNKGITYYGDDLYILEFLQDETKFKSFDELCNYLTRFADLITRSQYKTNWYIRQVSNAKILLTDTVGVVDFQAISNLSYFCKYSEDKDTLEVSKEVLQHLVKKSIEQFKKFKLKVFEIQQQQTQQQKEDEQQLSQTLQQE